ncbi:MAG: M14 family zinc carboxypeptidase, partial [Rhodothermales bacterium]
MLTASFSASTHRGRAYTTVWCNRVRPVISPLRQRLLLLGLIPILLTLLASGATRAQSKVKRTHLVALGNLSNNEVAKGLLQYDDYGRMVVSNVRGKLLVLATDAELSLMNERGWQPEVLMTDTSELQLFKRGIYGPTLELPPIYHTYEEIRSIADSLAKAHPKLVKRFTIGRTTQENREIFAVKISNDVDAAADKPVIMFDGCHHADEIMGAEIVTAIMKMLVEGYGKDPQITAWVDAYEIYLVPVVSVDGYHVVTHNIDPRWRKNTRDTNGNGVLYDYPEGVDVNRNYDFNWARGGTSDSTSVRYRGAYPFSEAENRAMRSLVSRIRPTLSISYHSQGEVVYYPWAWGERHAPDDKLLTEIAGGLAGSIRNMADDTTYV